MRILPRLVAFFLCTCVSPVGLATAQDTLRCLRPETAQYFQKEILPELQNFLKESEIQIKLQEGERIEDVLTFSYELAVASLGAPLGAWDEQIKKRTTFYTYVLCPARDLISLFALPEKETERVRQMAEVRPQMVKGAFYRLMIKLSIKRVTFELTPEMIRAYGGKLPPVEETFDLEIIEEFRSYDP